MTIYGVLANAVSEKFLSVHIDAYIAYKKQSI